MKHIRNITAALASLSLLSLPGLSQAAPTMEEMWKLLNKQQKQIQELQKKNTQLTEKVEINATIADQADKKSVVPAQDGSTLGTSGHGTSGKTTVGGYGELHYNNLDSGNEIDFHRFVLFFGHEFDEKTRFFSELELEHTISGSGKGGAVELEQAFIEHDLTDTLSAKAGLFLVPVGILNETHEPNTFYGVERNPVEKNIIPTTWWEGGLGLSGKVDNGLSYDINLTSGLSTPTTGANAYLIRKGRMQVANAPANDGALTTRLKWTGIPGLELATTIQYQEDITQGADSTAGSATLFETHAVLQKGPFALRALYAQWNLEGAGPKAVGRDKQNGWYIEPAYKITPKLGIFARYNQWDNNAGNAALTEVKQTNVGFNYWVHEDVVLKMDIQEQSGASDNDGINLGLGYQF